MVSLKMTSWAKKSFSVNWNIKKVEGNFFILFCEVILVTGYSHRVGDSCPNIVLNFWLFAPSCPLFLPLASFKKPHRGLRLNGPILSEEIVQILDFNKYKVSLNKLWNRGNPKQFHYFRDRSINDKKSYSQSFMCKILSLGVMEDC